MVLENEKVPEIIIDKNRTTQVIINLLSNALKFTDENGEIKLSSEIIEQESKSKAGEKENFLKINIKDNGIGISKEDQKKLFQPFSQIESGLSRNKEGSGLGLVICKGIVEKHDGDIWIESEEGKGSTFSFTLSYDIKNIEGGELELFSPKSKVI